MNDLYPNIASSLPFKERASFNLNTYQWLQTLTENQLRFITDLGLKAHALLFRRLAEFISFLDQQLYEGTTEVFTFNKNNIKEKRIAWDEYNDESIEYFPFNFMKDFDNRYRKFAVELGLLKNDNYVVRIAPDQLNVILPSMFQNVITENFPMLILAMIVLWDVELSEWIDRTDDRDKAFDQLKHTIKILSTN